MRDLAEALDIVIVNWNSGDYLRACVASLEDQYGGLRDLRVFVIDNASTDGSQRLAPSSRIDIRVVQNETNLGFGAACNQGAALGNAPLILFLNPDVVVTDASLRVPVDHLAAHPETGVCSIQLVDQSGRVSATCSRHPTMSSMIGRATGLDRMFAPIIKPQVMRDFDHRRDREVDEVIGAFFMIRRSAFEKLNGFDPRFFLYFEEVDLCVRATASGERIMFLSGASAMHVGGGSTRQIAARRQFYSARSRILFAFKHWGIARGAVIAFILLVIEPPVRATYFAATGRLTRGLEMLASGVLLWRDMPAVLSHSHLRTTAHN
jgi:hypothetical protein